MKILPPILCCFLAATSFATVTRTEFGVSALATVATNFTAYLSDWTYLTARNVTSHESGFSLGWRGAADRGLSLGETLTNTRRRHKGEGPGDDGWVTSNSQTLRLWWLPIRDEKGNLLLASAFQWKEVPARDYGMYKGSMRWTWHLEPCGHPLSFYTDFEFRVTGNPAFSGWDRLCQLRPKVGLLLPFTDILSAGLFYRAQYTRAIGGDWNNANVCGFSAGFRF